MKRPLKRPHSSVPGPRPQTPAQSQRAAARLAFTLLELLIAIAIIAILASLILAVAGSASIKVHNAQVSADILTLSTSIAAFKQKYGIEPPSSITLYEHKYDTSSGHAPNWADDPRSMGLIRQIWPQFDFSYAAEGGAIDINGNGATTDVISLSGTECLVFFLGGIPGPGGTAGSNGPPMGFSQNPADPFSVTGVGASRQVVGTNRDRFADFDVSRLFLYPPANNTVSGVLYHSMNTYKDTLSGQQQPYLYLSSYGGQGYNVTGELASPPLGTFADIYRQGPNGATSASPSPPWNPSTYQIISPGGDQQYGAGGEYEAGDPKGLLVGTRSNERDNITNFTGGTLAP
jgi:general secretion pathway protein G